MNTLPMIAAAVLVTVASAAEKTMPGPNQKAAAVANPSTTENGKVAGLYLATTRQLRFNPLGGSGSADWEVRTEFYLLSRDGRVFRGRDLPNVPGGEISRFDFDAARREAPGNYGTYTLRGTQVILQLGDAPVETIAANRLEPDVLEIRSTKFKRSVPDKSPSPPPASGAVGPASVPAVAGAVGSVPVLVHAAPAGFIRTAEASTVYYTAREAKAGAEVYAFRPYTGDIALAFQQTLLRDWIDPRHRESHLAAPPDLVQYRIPGATLALVAGFHENQAGQLNERARVLIVSDRMAAIVDIHADTAATWQTMSPAIRALLDSLHVEQQPAPASSAGSRPPK